MWPMVIMLAGSAVQAGGGMFGASQALKQSKYQQDILRYQADYERAAAEINVQKIKRRVGEVISSQRAQTAASGFQPDTGTAMELQVASQMEGDIDIAILRSAGGLEQLRLSTAGHMARAEGYGQAAGYSQRAFGSLLGTATWGANRAGMFSSGEGTPASTSLLSSGYGPQR
jgi:hypothetical protein